MGLWIVTSWCFQVRLIKKMVVFLCNRLY